MLTRKASGVVAIPQNRVVGLGDDYQFFRFLHRVALVNERQPNMLDVTIADCDFQSSAHLRWVDKGQGC